MKRQLLTIFVLLVTGLAVACDAKQPAAEKAAEPAAEKEQSDDEPGEPQGASSQLDIPEDQAMKGMSEGKNFYVVVTPEPNPIPFQEMFALEVTVFSGERDDNPAKGVKLDQVRATMPAHGHGMKTEPKITEVSPGRFRVEGMKFHMQGEGEHGLWVIETVIAQDDTIDQAKFDVQCCREQ